MAKNLYVGVGSKARKVKALYVGVGGKARKVKKVYVGVGGKARLVYTSYVAVTGITLSAVNEAGVISAAITPSNSTTKKVSWSIKSLDYTSYALVDVTDTTCRIYLEKSPSYTGHRCILSATVDGITKTVTCTQIGSGYMPYYGHVIRFSYVFN